MNQHFKVIALYKFVALPDFKEIRDKLFENCEKNEIKGSILLAPEGINGTIAGPLHGIESFLQFLKSDQRFADIEYKESFCEKEPFLRLKVKLKKEIVTLGRPEADPTKQVGTYVKPEDWNRLIQDPEVIVVDTRNDYEVEIGTFEKALNPKTESFTEFPNYVEKNLDPSKHKKVAMFCTGGIRCEKATAYMLSKGFKDVYHLQGGILKYLEEIPPEKSLWKGECFVFDGRVSVDHDLNAGNYKLCFGCQFPVGPNEINSPLYKEGVCCPRCHDKQTPEQRQRAEERNRQMKIARSQNKKHLANKMLIRPKRVQGDRS